MADRIVVEIEIDAIEHFVSLPGAWSDLNTKQWTAVLDLMNGARNNAKVVVRRLSAICGHTPLLSRLDVISLNDIVMGMDWMMSPPMNSISHFRGWGLSQSPKDKMENVRVKEYLLVSEFLKMWADAAKEMANAQKTYLESLQPVVMESENPLEEMVTLTIEERDAIVDASRKKMDRAMDALWAAGTRMRWLPWSGWLRWMNFEENMNLKLARFVPAQVKFRTLYNYWGLLQWLREVYPEPFQQTGSGNGVGGSRALIIGIAGDKFGNVNEVMVSNIHDVMTYMRVAAVAAANIKQD